MAKLKLQPEPTFKAKARIPVPGAAPEPVEFTFRWRDRDELQAFIEASVGRPDAETLLEIADGWDLSDPWERASVEQLVRKFIGAPRAIFDAYVNELTGAREKN